MNKKILEVVDNYALVGYLPLNIKEEESVEAIMAHVDGCVQFGEHVEPKEYMYNNMEESY